MMFGSVGRRAAAAAGYDPAELIDGICAAKAAPNIASLRVGGVIRL